MAKVEVKMTVKARARCLTCGKRKKGWRADSDQQNLQVAAEQHTRESGHPTRVEVIVSHTYRAKEEEADVASPELKARLAGSAKVESDLFETPSSEGDKKGN